MRIRYLAALAAAGLAFGCTDSFVATQLTIPGGYHATLFTSDSGGTTTDWLDAGATLVISLAANGTTTGHLFVPGGGEGGGDLDADMAGTWSLSGSVVTFVQPNADTFVRDMPFLAKFDRLEGDHTFGGTRVKVILRK